jgi:hypothetical protein
MNMPRPLTPDEAVKVRMVLDLARDGKASLGELGTAHDLAESAGLTATAGELRGYVRHKVTPKTTPDTGRDLVLGIASGMITHHLLGKI